MFSATVACLGNGRPRLPDQGCRSWCQREHTNRRAYASSLVAERALSGILWEFWSGIVGFGKRLLLGQRPERSRCLGLIRLRLGPEGPGETKAWPAGESRFEVLKSLVQVLVQGTNEYQRSHDDRESDPTRPQLRIRPDFWLPA